MSWSSDWAAPFLWIILSPLATVLLSVFMYTALAHPVPPEEIGLPPNETGPIEFFGPVVKTDTEPACHTFAVTCYEYAPVIPTLLAFVLPGLLNLVPFAWLLRRGAAVRAAAAVAGLLGLLRLAIPVAVLLLGYERVSVPEGGTYFRFIVDGWFEVFGEPYDAIWAAGALAWFGSLLAWGVFALVVFAPGLKSSERTAAR